MPKPIISGRTARAAKISKKVAQDIERGVKVVGRTMDAAIDVHDLDDLATSLQHNLPFNESISGEQIGGVQEDEEPLPTPWRGVPFVQPEAPEPDLAALLQRNLQLHEPVVEEQAEEDSNEPRDVHELEASQDILQFIGRFEEFRSRMYKVNGVGRWTIGYGHEIDDDEKPRYETGVTREQAEELLRQDVQEAIGKIRRHVSVQLTQHQFDALVSYIYNTGSIYGSKLLENLNAGNLRAAAREMDIVKQTNPSTGEREVLRGLEIRREQEQQLFLEGNYGN